MRVCFGESINVESITIVLFVVGIDYNRLLVVELGVVGCDLQLVARGRFEISS